MTEHARHHAMKTVGHAEWLCLTAFLAWLTAGGAPPTTVALRRYQLERFALCYPHTSPWQISDADIAAWLAGHEWSRETLRSYRSALRSFYGWARASGLIDHDPSRLLRSVPATVGHPRPAPERVIDGALTVATERVQRMIMLGSRYGLRRAEIAQVNRKDLTLDECNRWSLIVHGKGGKPRTLPLMDDMAHVIRDCDDPAGWLFPNGLGSHLTPAHLGKLVRRALGEATTHQLRHRFGTVTYRRTKDIRAVQMLLGHASVSTTQVYTAPADDAMREAIRRAHTA